MSHNLFLEDYEVLALQQWHRDQQYEAAGKQEYTDADAHKKRADALEKLQRNPNSRPVP